MTNENMIKQLKRLIPSLKYADDVNAVNGAIKALSQGPIYWIGEDGIVHKLVTMELVPDAVIREEVLQAVSEGCQEWRGIYGRCEELINALPSVNPPQEPCDDAVNRILQRMWNCRGKHTASIDKVKMEQIIRDELPSVTQKYDNKYRKEAKRWKNKWLKSQKSGKWQVVSDGYGDSAYICECSECKDTVWVYKNADRKWKYCPSCGAKMVEPQESEDKECGK